MTVTLLISFGGILFAVVCIFAGIAKMLGGGK